MREKVYYVYRHVRLDTNEVFYVGVGTKHFNVKTFRSMYRRAFDKTHRNKGWESVASNVVYDVEIISEMRGISEKFLKEKEFIKLYGRIDLNQGTLVNVCDGGGGTRKRIVRQETRQKISETQSRMYASGELVQPKKKVYAYRVSDGKFYKKFSSYTETAKHFGVTYKNVSAFFRGKSKQCCKMILFSEYQGEKVFVDFNHIKPKGIRSVNCFDRDMNFIREFPSVKDAASFVKKNVTNVSEACRKEWLCGGYRFSYVVKTSPAPVF